MNTIPMLFKSVPKIVTHRTPIQHPLVLESKDFSLIHPYQGHMVLERLTDVDLDFDPKKIQQNLVTPVLQR